jgi:hypothetical protein
MSPMKRKAYENCLPWEGSSSPSAPLASTIARCARHMQYEHPVEFIVHMDRE